MSVCIAEDVTDALLKGKVITDCAIIFTFYDFVAGVTNFEIWIWKIANIPFELDHS